ncbi:MBOAT family O-acyltransferase [Paenibacillus glycanilyticus]|uniref:MBOAT family O-acyltransferase n=1 Tax=Paenibacillus glycanilyticus TaxID=126569 RepID=UPI0019100704|nr:MBOAT family protein [Paenibacillus glycanilyticus]
MFFYSPNFIVFFIVLLIPFYLFPKQRIYWLAAANAIFYTVHPEGFIILFFTMCLLTFSIVKLMCRPGWRWTFWVGIAANILNLALFKYSLFALSNLKLIGITLPGADHFASTIVLPLGISFYTFEFISYLVDVRRSQTRQEHSFLQFWVFVSMFPHLIAGPIMRGSELFPQLGDLNKRSLSWSQIKYGSYLFIVGLMKKLVIADQLSPLVEAYFNKGYSINGTDSWIAGYLFSFFIYADFSSYTDMAMGLGVMLGVKFAENFKSPYLSGDPSEFWRRWHMTLSRWIRDYIYISLGGNRKGSFRTIVNLMITMVISGLWHGAMWTFVVWGGIHGLMLIIHRLTLGINKYSRIAIIRKSRIYRLVAIIIFFHLVTWTWILFHANSLHMAIFMTSKMLQANVVDIATHPYFWLAVGLYGLHVMEYFMRKNEQTIGRAWYRIPFPLRGAGYVLLLLALMYFAKGEEYAFIYFQF